MAQITRASSRKLRISWEKRWPDALNNYDWYWERLVDCQHLLTLLVGQPVYPKRVLLYHKEADSVRGRDVSLFYTHSYRKPEKVLHEGEMLFPFPVLGDQWPAVASAWFEKKAALRNAYGLVTVQPAESSLGAG